MTLYYYAAALVTIAAIVLVGAWLLAVFDTRRDGGTTRARAARYVPRHLTEKHNLDDTVVVARVSDVSGGKS